MSVVDRDRLPQWLLRNLAGQLEALAERTGAAAWEGDRRAQGQVALEVADRLMETAATLHAFGSRRLIPAEGIEPISSPEDPRMSLGRRLAAVLAATLWGVGLLAAVTWGFGLAPAGVLAGFAAGVLWLGAGRDLLAQVGLA